MKASSRVQPFFRRSEGYPACLHSPYKLTIPSLMRFLFLPVLLVATSSAGDAWVMRDDGAGPAKIGMTLAQLSAALHQKLTEEDSGSENCFYVRERSHNHISFMFEDGKLARIDVNAPGIATSAGIQVGDSEAVARTAYEPKIKVTDPQYTDSGHYLPVRSSDGHYGIRFET